MNETGFLVIFKATKLLTEERFLFHLHGFQDKRSELNQMTVSEEQRCSKAAQSKALIFLACSLRCCASVFHLYSQKNSSTSLEYFEAHRDCS